MYKMPFQTTLFLDSKSAEGSTSNFAIHFIPSIELDAAKTYELAFISADIWYSWHNITPKNNKFRYSPTGDRSAWVNLAVPPGAYNVIDINAEVKRFIKATGHEPDNISIAPNFNTLKIRITLAGNYKLDLRDKASPGNLRSVLEFGSALSGNGDHDSDRPVDITSINTLAVRCSLGNSSYINGSLTVIINSFSPSLPTGYQ